MCSHVIRVIVSLSLLSWLIAACGTAPAAAPAEVASPTPAATTATATGSAGPAAASERSPASPGATDRPDAIVSLSPTATEILFAIGAGDQVVAVDDQSDFPPRAPMTGLSGLQPNVEAITEYDPDLVVLSFDPGDIVSGLEAVGVPVLVQPTAATLDDTYAQIEELGAVTGHRDEAAEVVADMTADIDRVVAQTAAPAGELTYYHELDTTYIAPTSDTFIGQIYSLFGLTNIADAAATEDSAGYPQLSAEFIVEADPDLIFLADVECCGVTATAVAERPGWAGISAVEGGNIVELDGDIASRWGPRVVDFVATVAAAVTAVADATEPAA